MNKWTRLCVLTLVLTLLLSGFTVTSLAEELTFADTISWNAVYDVVVVGFGGAGGTSAITAADLGANVLLVDKAPEGHEGGNTRYALQAILSLQGKDAAMTYFKALRGPYDQSEAIIEAFVDKSLETAEWLEKMEAGKLIYLSKIPASLPEFDFEGGESTAAVLIDGEIFTSKFWNLIKNSVEKRAEKIEVWYNAPGKELIQDPVSKTIIGVRIEKDGEMLNIRALNGVVLSTGGFEANQKMVANYLNLPELYPMGSTYNTGDGILMAQAVGADLWHMGTYNGGYLNFKAPGADRVFVVQLRGEQELGGQNCIFVGGDATRFVDESVAARHGYLDFHGRWITGQVPDRVFAIFDETARGFGRIYRPFSEGNLDEIEKGWILKADSIEELAKLIDLDPDALSAEVAKFNGYCSDGKDQVFGRNPKTLKPIETGPFYAMRLYNSVINTQGGPRRNERAEVIDTQGNPIPHLYSAGELGSIFPNIYQGAGNLAECIAFGRIAGENAAQVKTDALPPLKFEKAEDDLRSFEAQKQTFEAAENELIGTGKGIGGLLTVKVTMDGDKMVAIDIISHNETVGISDGAMQKIPQRILETQSTEVDIISGATITSNAIREAVEEALASK